MEERTYRWTCQAQVRKKQDLEPSVERHDDTKSVQIRLDIHKRRLPQKINTPDTNTARQGLTHATQFCNSPLQYSRLTGLNRFTGCHPSPSPGPWESSSNRTRAVVDDLRLFGRGRLSAFKVSRMLSARLFRATRGMEKGECEGMRECGKRGDGPCCP